MNITRTKFITSAVLVSSALIALTSVIVANEDKKIDAQAPVAVAPKAPAKPAALPVPSKNVATNIDMDQLISNNPNIRIGFVNQYDIGQSTQGMEANKLIENKYKELGEKLQKSGQQLAQAENELKSKGSLLSKDAFEDQQKKFVKLKNDHQSKMEEYEVDLKSTVRQVTESVLKEFQQAVVEIANEEGYQAIIDMEGKVLYAQGSLNVTPRVVQKMNSRRSTKITTAQAKTPEVKTSPATKSV
jgi:Skp family chaperone for outer membrane proteins